MEQWVKELRDDLFIISSAIYTPRGVFHPDERFQQTLKTIESVKLKVPDVKILIYDSSTQQLNQRMEDELRNRGASIVFLHEDVEIQKLSHRGLNSAAECLATAKTFYLIKHQPEISKLYSSVGRIFKISGRYELSDDFYLHNYKYDGMFGHYTFKEPIPSWLPKEKQEALGVDKLLVTRLWSLCPSLIDNYMGMAQKILDSCLKDGLDLEHAMYKHLDRKYLIGYETVGVKGRVALSGEMMYD